MEEAVIIKSTRASAKSPTTFENISKEAIEGNNTGQDLPYLMSMSPSVVVNSDAGTGIGYTSMRIRGTDLTRINVTINGIPYNDAESQGVFWVDLPDFVSSVDNIQIQRGVGTSTNGAAAFGASVNIQTLTTPTAPYGEVQTGAGSFNSFRNTVKAGTGLINDKWAFDTRLSKISSDGFIDRAASDLKSFFVSGGYFGKNTIVKANVFSGKERTYQSWYGVPKVRLENDLEGMQRYANHGLFTQEETDHMIQSDSRTYNYYTYDNEVDDYQQDHYQLIMSHQFNKQWLLNAALHYTHGEGFYEQKKENEMLGDYGITVDVNNHDTPVELVRQKWLNNDFYGIVTSLNYQNILWDITIGGGYNEYDGDHYGKILWSEPIAVEKDYQWYFNNGLKKEFNTYAKAQYRISESLTAYADVQYRAVDYNMDGIHDNLMDLTQEHHFDFFNPKAGLRYKISDKNQVYGSVAVANREPGRNNFRDADPGEVPKHETLTDYELGFTHQGRNVRTSINVYYMDYLNQLVLTGAINNVGEPVMTNVEDSYRAGIEWSGGLRILKSLTWEANATFSKNRIKNFVSYTDNWDAGEQIETTHSSTHISFSPDIIAASQFEWKPSANLRLDLQTKYVGKQFIDNTSNDTRSIDPYLVNNLKIGWDIPSTIIKKATLGLQINNLLDAEYETNAWVYRYHYQDTDYMMSGYFPQAGRNYMVNLLLQF